MGVLQLKYVFAQVPIIALKRFEAKKTGIKRKFVSYELTIGSFPLQILLNGF